MSARRKKTAPTIAPEISTPPAAADIGAPTVIALDALTLSPIRNARTTVEGPVDGLAASIAAVGLIQNLVVHPMEDGRHGVCAGGRRLAALLQLRDAGRLAPDHPVLCLVIPEADALMISLAENVAREAMNPADEARAFAGLIAEGRTVAQVAAAFGETERYVRARERLGRLAAPVLEAFRTRRLSVEQAQAFASLDDAERQKTVFAAWEKAPAWEKDAHVIRRMMAEDRVSAGSRLGRLIGREAYEAAGGAVDEDLFGESVWFADAELVTRLATEKLETEADAVVAEGWRWSAVMLDYDARAVRGLERLHPVEVELTEADNARWEAIEALLEDEETSAEDYERLSAELDALQEKTSAFTEAQKAVSGALVYLDNAGAVRVERGLQRPEDKALAAPEATEACDDGETGEGDASRPQPEPMRVTIAVGEDAPVAAPARTSAPRDPWSAALRADLRQVLQGALQIAVAEDAALARDLLEFEIVMAERAQYGWREGGLELRLTKGPARLEHDGWRYDEAALELPATAVDASALDGADLTAAFAAFRTMDAAARGALVAAAVASGVRAALPADDGAGAHDYATDWRARRAATARLRAAAAPDIRRIWTPTKDNLLSRVSKQILLDLVEATVGPEAARLMLGAKKGELVDYVNGLFNDEDARARLDDDQRARLDAWLPAPLVAAAAATTSDNAEEADDGETDTPGDDLEAADDDDSEDEVGEADGARHPGVTDADAMAAE